MALYPLLPAPASTHVATARAPLYRFESDFGYDIRRARYPRPLRTYQLDYLGLTTSELHTLREFLLRHRLALTPFQWHSIHIVDSVAIASTSPILLGFSFGPHTYLTGQWILVTESTIPNLNGVYQITYVNPQQLTLNNTTAAGTGTAKVWPYLPKAVGQFDEDTLPSAAKLMGPESMDTPRGRFTMTVVVRELL